MFFIQLAVKQPFKFPPHLMSASPLPMGNETHEIGVKMNKRRQKDIPDIIDCILKKDG